ncbi:MarR family winged helix-turn-helix transcriptional regulator [Rhabdothermincola salaria]|uniref:MarR family winged helix-turn-helix transcriptional regulator n=1 Tax=Rhabdothermincola salaria TaxID=2903142 RepID=UPI001E5BD469|nr:MarR family winged helix-turn-helix transcriptional regulator [Rhabdothermincola salaria]MCD9624678.1 MarR family winged helix-turn-helix transcriptional regulator [Rhabdothermincola salaria]
MAHPPELTTLTLLLARASRLNEAVIGDVCRRHAVAPAELRVLGALRLSSGGAPMRPTVLGGRVVQTSGGLTATLRRLEAAGAVERVGDPEDGRVRLVALTPEGEQLHDRLLDDLTARYAVTFDGDLDADLAAVRRLLDRLEAMGDVASSAHWAPPEV